MRKLCFIFIIALLIPPVCGEIVTVCENGCDYSSIQSALTAASEDDVIEIGDGSYQENVVINKTVQLVGSKGTTLLAVRPEPSIHVLADDVVIRGLYIPYGLTGIRIEDSNNVTVEDCRFDRGVFGVRAVRSSHNDILNSDFTSINYSCILLENSHSNLVENNSLKGNSSGVYLIDSTENNIISNIIWGEGGIFLQGSTNNVVERNELRVNKTGLIIFESGGNSIHSNQANTSTFLDFKFSPSNEVSENSVKGMYARNYKSYNNVFVLTNFNLTGEEFEFSLFEPSLQEGTPIGQGINVTIIPDIYTDRGSIYLEAAFAVEEMDDVDVSTVGFYLIKNEDTLLISDSALKDDELTINASIDQSGRYVLLGKEEKSVISDAIGTLTPEPSKPPFWQQPLVAIGIAVVVIGALGTLAYVLKRR